MCIIATIPAGERISKKTFTQCGTTNKDGFGMSYFDTTKNRLFYFKTTDYKSAWRNYREIAGLYDMVLHFRFATHGASNQDNCHPFLITNGVFFHNGILHDFGSRDQSDTADFAETVLNRLPADILDRQKYLDFLETYAKAQSSKFVFQKLTGEIIVLNKTAGVQEGKIWYSNYGFRSYTVTSYYDGHNYALWPHETSRTVYNSNTKTYTTTPTSTVTKVIEDKTKANDKDYLSDTDGEEKASTVYLSKHTEDTPPNYADWPENQPCFGEAPACYSGNCASCKAARQLEDELHEESAAKLHSQKQEFFLDERPPVGEAMNF
jgi:predicted glutamine amidotransferase